MRQLMKEAGLTVNDLKTEDGVLAAFEKVKSMKVDGAPVVPLQINGKVYRVLRSLHFRTALAPCR